jgi:hypothetical protein
LPIWVQFLPIKRRFPNKFRPFGGGSYWCLRKECVQYIHGFVEGNPRFINFFKYVHIPDEMFFQTVLLNSPYKEKIINNNLIYIDWSRDREMPALLNTNDFKNILDSQCLFARKFDATKDEKNLDMIDCHILDAK